MEEHLAYYIQFLWIVVPVLVVVSSVYCLRCFRGRRRPITDDSYLSPLIADTVIEVLDLELAAPLADDSDRSADSDRSPPIGDTVIEVLDLEAPLADDSDRSADSDRSPPIGDTETEVSAPRAYSNQSPLIGDIETEKLDLELRQSTHPDSEDRPLPSPINHSKCGPAAWTLTGHESKNPVFTEQLTNENFKEVFYHVWGARLYWKVIGLHLGLKKEDLDVIGVDNRDKTDLCFGDMVHLWLIKQESPTWQDMISALKCVGYPGLAKQIITKLTGGDEEVPPTTGRNLGLSPSSDVVIGDVQHLWHSDERTPNYEFPFLETDNMAESDRVMLKAKLSQDTKQIMTDFACLLIEMLESFKEGRSRTITEIANAIWTVADCDAANQSLRAGTLLDVENTDSVTIESFFQKLQCEKYVSFINYHIVEFLINRYGSEQDKERLHWYSLNFKDYCRRSVFEVPQSAFGANKKDGRMFVCKVTSKIVDTVTSSSSRGMPVDDVYTSLKTSSENLNISLGDALAIQDKIAKTLHLNPAALVLQSASKGCIQLTFSVTETVKERIKEQTESDSVVSGDTCLADLEVQGILLMCDAPSKPSAEVNRNGCITLQWNKPEYQGLHPVQHYKIHYRSVDDPPTEWKALVTEHLIVKENLHISPDMLQLHHNYNTMIKFKVEAVSDIGGIESEASDAINVQLSSTFRDQESQEHPNWKHTISALKHESVKENLIDSESAQIDQPHTTLARIESGDEYSWNSDEPTDDNAFPSLKSDKLPEYQKEKRRTKLRKDTEQIRTELLDSSDRSPLIGDTETEQLDLEVRHRSESTPPVLRACLTLSINFRDVHNKVWRARASWYSLGIQLGLDIDQLDIINLDNHDDTDSCFREMITLWLKMEHPNWQDMISALKHESVNENQLAERIHTALIDSESHIDQPHTTLGRIESGDEYSWNSDEPTEDNAFPSLKSDKLPEYQKEKRRTKLRKDTEQIRTELLDRSDRSPLIVDTETEQLDLEVRHRSESTSPVLRASLTSQNFKDVLKNFNKVWKARDSWYNLGIQLGMEISQLDVINLDNRNDTDSCFREMITLWLRQENPNWQDMISALKHESVSEKQLAERIHAALTDSESTQIDQPHTTLTRIESGDEYSRNSDKPTIDKAFPNLEFDKLTYYQKKELKAKLRRDTRKTRTEFASLLVDMRQSLKKFDPKQIAISARTIAMCEPSIQSLGSKLQIDDVNSIDTFITQLEKDNYISFINYRIVEFLINKYGSEEDKKNLDRYMINFKDYCKRSVFEVPQDAYTQYGVQARDLDERKLFVFKVTKGMLDSLSQYCTPTEDESAMNNAAKISSQGLRLSLGDALAIQDQISETLNLNPAALILVGASKGCVELTFSVPKAVIDRVTTLNETTRKGFADLESQGIHLLCGPPGKPWAIPVRHACVSLQWNKPKYQGVQPVQEYSVHYQSVYDSPSRWKVLKTDHPIKKNNIDLSLYAHQFGKNATCIFKVEAKSVTGSTFSEESLPVDIPWPNDDHDSHHHEIIHVDLSAIMAKTRGVADKWREIGAHLGLTEQTLDEIEEDNSESTECLQNVLRKWIEQSEASMEKLRSALGSSSVRAYKQGDELAFSLSKQGSRRSTWYAN